MAKKLLTKSKGYVMRTDNEFQSVFTSCFPIFQTKTRIIYPQQIQPVNV